MMTITYLLVSVCLLWAVSKGQEAADNMTKVEMQEERPTENLKELSVSLNEGQDGDNSNLSSTQGGCENLYEIGKEVGALGERLESTVRALEETRHRLEASEAKLTTFNNSFITALNKEKPLVAFSASMPGALTAGSTNAPVVYKQVVLNIGNAYNPGTGSFIAPVDGVYYFSFSSFFWGGSGSGTTGGSLFRNGGSVVSWFSQNVNHPITGSNSAALMLRAGDQVNVCVWPGSKISDNVNKYSSFSGFLLFQM